MSRALHVWRARCAAAIAAILLAVATPATAAWERAHGDATNSSFADVATAPAGAGSMSVPGLGQFADGAGPVVAPDGTVYLGSWQGTLHALHPDGSKAWSRTLPSGQRIMSSPAIGADGSIYVLATKTVKNSRGKVTGFRSFLHKFVAGGGWLWNVPMPDEGGGDLATPGLATAPPNILRDGAGEVVIVPVLYQFSNGSRAVRLFAFSTGGGQVVGKALVSSYTQPITSSGITIDYVLCFTPPHTACPLISGFTAVDGPSSPTPDDRLPPDTKAPFPAAAVLAPWVIVSDGSKDLVAYTYDRNGGFAEKYRANGSYLYSPPSVTAGVSAAVGVHNGLMLVGPQGSKSTISGIGGVVAAPSRDNNSRVFLVERAAKRLTVMHSSGTILSRIPLPGESIVSAAVSRSHVFVATANALLTYDAGTMQRVSRFDWYGGGRTHLAIGPQGHLYAIASHVLFVFPPPKTCLGCGAVGPLTAGVEEGAAGTASSAGQATLMVQPLDQAILMPGTAAEAAPAPAPQPGKLQRYKDPKGPSGLLLYACTEVGGSTCERPVALAFCQGQGYANAGKYDTDNKKTKAETLAGEVCSKKRCRVFEYIDCRR